MANKIPLAIADLELQLATTLAVGGTSFTLSGSTDDDGVALPTGMYCFTVDNGTSNKEYLLGQVNGTAVTSVVSVSRQGTETSGAVRKHRIGAPVLLTDFATIQRVADVLRGQLNLDGSSPLSYDAEPTLSNRKQLATVAYVLDTVSGGTVAFDAQTIAGNAGETFSAGSLVYFNTADQEWYKTDADTSATIQGVQLGIAIGAGTNGVAITGGVQISGTYPTTGLTAGSTYYASNTAGGISTSAGTNEKKIGIALSTTKLLLLLSTFSQEALAGGSTFGTPSSTNKFITQDYNSSATGLPVVRTYLNAGSPATWSKPAGLKYVVVEVQAGGGGGGGSGTTGTRAGAAGGGGGYSKKTIAVATLGATETVTTGAGGTGGTAGANNGSTGGSSSFGAHATATGGEGGGHSGTGIGGGGGTGSSGDINIAGGSGSHGNMADETSGPGGSSHLGGGAKGVRTDVNGNTGGLYGGGGSGGSKSTANKAGGDGAAGIVIVTEYYS